VRFFCGSRNWANILIVISTCLAVRSPVVAASPAAVRLEVPFFPDRTDQCGPSTLAGVLSFFGKPIEPKQLKQEMYVAKLNGTLPMDLVYAAESHGLKTEMVRGDLDKVRGELTEGRPVLAMLDVGYTVMPMHHYVTITGFDEGRKGLYAHSAGKANQFFSYKKFLKQWNKTDNWAVFFKQP
jgi:ABC-type bacteriocin/lantibiotic exporter with double-glycine peptidase domain